MAIRMGRASTEGALTASPSVGCVPPLARPPSTLAGAPVPEVSRPAACRLVMGTAAVPAGPGPPIVLAPRTSGPAPPLGPPGAATGSAGDPGSIPPTRRLLTPGPTVCRMPAACRTGRGAACPRARLAGLPLAAAGGACCCRLPRSTLLPVSTPGPTPPPAPGAQSPPQLSWPVLIPWASGEPLPPAVATGLGAVAPTLPAALAAAAPDPAGRATASGLADGADVGRAGGVWWAWR
jgi:hypothetical protein